MRQWELHGITDDVVAVPPAGNDGPGRAVDRFPMVFWTTDADLGFTSSPEAALRQLELPGDRFSGTTLFDVFGLEESGLEMVASHLLAMDTQPVSFELRRNGKVFRCWVSALCDPRGEAVGTICVALSDGTGSGRAVAQSLGASSALAGKLV